MALALDDLDSHLDFRKIPVIDLRYLSQDEINCAAQCSDEYLDLRVDDIVVPKIDRSIFNESAGSRKQTYSRLRLSQRRKQQLGGVTRRRAGLLSVSRSSIGGGRNHEGTSDLNDNNHILQLLRQLFTKGERPVCKITGDQIRKDLLTLQSTHLPSLNSASASNPSSNSTLDHDSDVVCPPKVEDSLQLVESNNAIQDMQIESSIERVEDKTCDDASVISDAKMQQASMTAFLDMDRNKITLNESLDRPKKKLRTKEDARRKGQHVNAQEKLVLKIPGDTHDISMENCSRITTIWNAGAENDKTADVTSNTIKTIVRCIQDETTSNCSQSDQISADMNNTVTQNSAYTGDIQPLGTQEPVVPQLKRRFRTLETEADLQAFFEKLGGEWASKRKKRKIVDAEAFVQGFPKGWKVLLGVRKKDSRFIIECRKYISPDGQQLASCREVSAYMLSTQGQCPAVVPSETPSCLSAKNVHDYVIKTSSMPCNSVDPVDSGGGCSEHYSSGLNDIAFIDNEHKQTSQKSASNVTLGMVQNKSSKDHDVPTQNMPVKCSKCNINFSNTSTLIAHMAVHHGQKEKKTRSAKSSIADGVIMVDGKYECQICHKVFNERHRYTGHVGIHVRNAKRPQDFLGEISNATGKPDPNLHDICDNKIAKDTNLDSSVILVSKHCNQEENADSDLHDTCDNSFTEHTNLDTTMTKVSNDCNQQEQNANSNRVDVCGSKFTEDTNLDANVTSIAECCNQQEHNTDSNLNDISDNKYTEDPNHDATVTSVSEHCNLQEQNADPNLHDICDYKYTEDLNHDATVTSVSEHCNLQEQNADPNLHDIHDYKYTEDHNHDVTMTSVSEHCNFEEQIADSNLHDICNNKYTEDPNHDATVTSLSKHCTQQEQNVDPNLHDICDNKYTEDPNHDATMTSVSEHCNLQEQIADPNLHDICDNKYTEDPNHDATVTSVSEYCNLQEQNVDPNLHDIHDNKYKEDPNHDATVTSVSEHCNPQEQNADPNLHDICDNKYAEDPNHDATVTSVFKHCNLQEQNADPDLHDICDNECPEEANLDDTVTSTLQQCSNQEQNTDLFSKAVPELSAPSGDNDFASSHEGQIFSAYDAASVKDELDYKSADHKIDSLTSFEQFQMEYMPKFSFETSQGTNSPINEPMDLGLDSSVLQQEMDPPGQFEWEEVLAKIENSNQHFVCVWCNQVFSHDGLHDDLQADSVGFICQNCKAKIGQVNI